MEAVIVIAVICIAFTLYAMPFGITKITPDDFLLMGRSAAVNQYNDTTVAYSLQVAVTIYFFYWGFEYGLSNLFFIATWFFGLLAFGIAAPKLAALISLPTFDGSLFSVLSYGRRHLRIFMGLLFIVSLIGLLFIEIYYTAQFVNGVTTARLKHAPTPTFYFWVGFIFLAIAVLWYCSLGGMRKVVLTDTWQLSIAYLGMAAFASALGPTINAHAGTHNMQIVEFGLAGLFAAMALLPSIASLVVQRRLTPVSKSTSRLTFGCLIISAIICAFAAVSQPYVPSPAALVFPKPLMTMPEQSWGWAPIAGFTLINLVWQFSDYTAFHRLALLDLPNDQVQKARRIRESIFVTMLNSPLTWGLGIFAGMAVDAAGLLPSTSTDVFNDFVARAAALANGGNSDMRVALISLAAFLAGVMLSTVDSGFMSVVLILVRDIIRQAIGAPARIVVNIGIIGLMAAFAVILVELKIDILVFLNATYSWGLVFGGLSIAHMMGKRVPPGWAYLSLISGAAIGAVSTFNPLHFPDLVTLILPSSAAIAVSCAIVLISPSMPPPGTSDVATTKPAEAGA